MPKLTRVLETALYVADLDQTATFNGDVLGLPCIHEYYRMRAYEVGGNRLRQRAVPDFSRQV